MVSVKTFRQIALSYPEAEEAPHFEKTSFRVRKKIFATLSEKDKRVCMKFSEIDQSSFCSFDPAIIYPVPNKWGNQGWTNIELSKVKREMLEDALTTAYCAVAPAKLAKPLVELRDSKMK